MNLGDQECFSHHGLAWISPDGKVYLLNESHARWARGYVLSDKRLLEKAGGFPDMGIHVLLSEGWIRVASATNLSVHELKGVSKKAWASVVSLMIQCVKAGSLSPESPVNIDHGYPEDRSMTLDLERFVSRFGGSKMVDELFESALSSLSVKVASRHLAASSGTAFRSWHDRGGFPIGGES